MWMANHSVCHHNLIISTWLAYIYIIILYCRLLHLLLLAFNAVAVKSLAAVSGGNQSEFSKKENANAVLLVASQVSECAFEIVTFPYVWPIRQKTFFNILVSFISYEMHLPSTSWTDIFKNFLGAFFDKILECAFLAENSACNGGCGWATRWCSWWIWFTCSSLCCSTFKSGISYIQSSMSCFLIS